MIRLLLAIASLGLAGHVSLPPPASMWLGWAAVIAGLALFFIGISAVLSWLSPSDAHVDARRRNRSVGR